jgi:hypothetical protein
MNDNGHHNGLAKVIFHLVFHDFRNSVAFWKFPKVCPFSHPVGVVVDENECTALVERQEQCTIKVLRENPAPISVFPPQILHGMTWN